MNHEPTFFPSTPPFQVPLMTHLFPGEPAPQTHPDYSRSENCTDLGNCLRLVRQFGAQFRYETGRRAYLVWDGIRWIIDSTGQMQRWARKVVLGIYQEASKGPTEDARKNLAQWAKNSESKKSLTAMVSLAQDEAGIAVRTEDLDASPYLINLRNGTLEVREAVKSFVFHKTHRPGDLCTKIANCSYDPDARCPRWDKFLAMILPDEEVRRLVQRAAGRSLIGGAERRPMLICYGNGANGKTTMLEALRTLLGDYATSTPTESLIARRDGMHPCDLARLAGTRFVFASEPENHQRLSESVIKRLLSGGEIQARHMYQGWFTFKPQFALWLDTNHLPVITGTDRGIWDRIRLIPFGVRIPDVLPPEQLRPNHVVQAEFEAESAGILNWMLEGLLAYLREGLGTARAIESAGTEYRSESDLLGEFLDTFYEARAGATTQFASVYLHYQSWCSSEGLSPMTKKSLSRELRDRGWTSRNVRDGVKTSLCWDDVTLK